MSNSLIRNFFKKFHLTLLKNINIKGGSEICSPNKKFFHGIGAVTGRGQTISLQNYPLTLTIAFLVIVLNC